MVPLNDYSHKRLRNVGNVTNPKKLRLVFYNYNTNYGEWHSLLRYMCPTHDIIVYAEISIEKLYIENII